MKVAGTRLNEDKWPIAIKTADHRTAIDENIVHVRSPRLREWSSFNC